jgi:perosamine synthetase
MKNYSRLFKPFLDKKDLKAVKKVFDRSWVGLGNEVTLFEKEFKKYIRTKNAIALNSGTAAINLAIQAFNFPKGKNILVNSITFSSSAMAIVANNLIPNFVDCDSLNLGFDVEDALKKIDNNTVAILLVYYGGHPGNLDKVISFAKKNKLKLIEDCAHTQGGEYRNKKLGTFGDFGCFSFEEKKGMTTGDGGMLVSNNTNLIKKIKPARWVGIDKESWKKKNKLSSAYDHWFYEVNIFGNKYNMNDLTAAIGREQLKKLKKFNNKKIFLIRKYLKNIKNIKDIKPIIPYRLNKSSYWIFGIRTTKRDLLIKFLKKFNIATGVHFYPLSMQGFFKKYNGVCPKAHKIWKSILTLPLHYSLTKSDIDFITSKINIFFNKNAI